MDKILKSASADNVTLETSLNLGDASGTDDGVSTNRVRDYRRLAIFSIICGISCVGISALINSVKAQERREADPEKAQVNSDSARKLSLIAISVWLGILVLTPTLMALLSYLFTLQD